MSLETFSFSLDGMLVIFDLESWWLELLPSRVLEGTTPRTSNCPLDASRSCFSKGLSPMLDIMILFEEVGAVQEGPFRSECSLKMKSRQLGQSWLIIATSAHATRCSQRRDVDE